MIPEMVRDVSELRSLFTCNHLHCVHIRFTMFGLNTRHNFLVSDKNVYFCSFRSQQFIRYYIYLPFIISINIVRVCIVL